MGGQVAFGHRPEGGGAASSEAVWGSQCFRGREEPPEVVGVTCLPTSQDLSVWLEERMIRRLEGLRSEADSNHTTEACGPSQVFSAPRTTSLSWDLP